MTTIYFIYEIDGNDSYDSIVIKHVTTNLEEAEQFWNDYNESYIDSDWNFILAEYNNTSSSQSDRSNILRDLNVLFNTENMVKDEPVIADDLKDYICNRIEDIAESHIEAWKDRYFKHRGNIMAIRVDIKQNHDHSCEIENAETELSRELDDDEIDHLTTEFENAVIKAWQNN